MALQHSSEPAGAPGTAAPDAGYHGVVGRTVSHAEGTRRTEILRSAASLIASSGLRTSMRDIADAAGILAGSLYHHFESKDAILLELIRAYHADLDRIGEIAQNRLDKPDSASGPDNIIALGSAIARCAVEHRAALQMSFYDPPVGDPVLRELARRPPTGIQEAMLQTLRAGVWSGYIRSDIDLPTLADRFCQTMLQVGLDIIRHNAPTDSVTGLLCRVMLEGLSSRSPGDRQLDRSPALAAADEVIETWTDEDPPDPKNKAARIRAVAREQFGRKGYEVTTIRDIAAAAGLNAANVFHSIGSKEQLLAAIMRSYGTKLGAGWVGVLRSDGTAIEKLDALSWIDINALVHFHDEFRIQLAWMRQSPPDTPNPGWFFPTRMRQLKTLLSEGIRSGQIRIDSPSKQMLSRCVVALLWIPENIVEAQGTRSALVLARDTVLRGVSNRKR